MMKRNKFLFILVIILLIFGVQFNYSQNKESKEDKEVFSEIYKKYGINIITDTTEMISSDWQASPVNGKAKTLSTKYYEKAYRIIDKALSEYPISFLKKYLKGISICDSLEFYGVSYGGTAEYSKKTVILTVKDYYSLEWAVETIHHEFNHLLVHYNDFPLEEWASYNKNGFKYGNGGAEAIRNGQSSTEKTEASFRNGFVCEYGRSAQVEDIATLTEYALSQKADFHARALNYPIIARKYELLKRFYYNLDKYFDESFWAGKKINKSEEIEVKQKAAAADSSVIKAEVNFYEYENPDIFSFEFTARKATYIGYYFKLDSRKIGKKSVEVSTKYFYQDGEIMGEFTKKFTSVPNSNDIECSWGFGWEKAGNWEKGRYKVHLYIDNKFFKETYFVVK
jgi:hypothetical protein